MSDVLTIPELRKPTATQRLAVYLRTKEVTGRRGSVAHMGDVELLNVSTAPLEIAYHMTVLQFLNLVVTKADGTVISEGHFGDRFAPTLEEHVLRLEPGESFTANVHLFATVPRIPIPPGVYSVQAVYDYNGDRAVSIQCSLWNNAV